MQSYTCIGRRLRIVRCEQKGGERTKDMPVKEKWHDGVSGSSGTIVGSDEAYFGLKLDCRAKTPSNRAIMLCSSVKLGAFLIVACISSLVGYYPRYPAER